MPHRTAGCGKSSLRPLMAGSSPSLPDGSNPSAAIVQSASDVQCSRLLKTTPSSELAHIMVLNTGIVNQGSIFNFSVE
ncbi:BsuBI-PstI family restriction endonuclease (PF06616) (plasmid) [Pseudomonas putida]|nr:BsuBI-PstI family restriction endonuclease (PF06616) [Pseudomonas putida]QIZ22791.1 BsuBI-PstI family restriction endonuclease (PF06616) [Pseudomonas putida]